MTGARGETSAALLLAMLSDCGPRRMRALASGGSAEQAVALLRDREWGVLRRRLRDCRGVGPDELERWGREIGDLDAEQLLHRHQVGGVDLEGPELLGRSEPWASDPEPPGLLFRRGAPVELAAARVAIVGTRRCTAYGRVVARELGAGLASAGVTVVSGVAAGIDGVAQEAALEAGGRVVGVVGSGLDRVYPRSNAELWRRLGEEGTLLSEYPLGVEPARWRFPARNRLIAALSDLVVVVESAESGGSLYTVDAALERDRQVGAVPGPVTNTTSAGTNRLLLEGASPIRDSADVLALLGCSVLGRGGELGIGDAGAGEVAGEGFGWLLDALGWEAATVDELVLRTSRGLGGLTAALGELQVRGVVGETGGWWERLR